MIDSSAYTISIRKVDYEGEMLFESSIREFPNVREYGDSYQEAYELALDSIETLAEMYAEEGRALPNIAHTDENYSGRITLRMAKSLHHACALRADEEEVSLNSWVNTVIAEYVGRTIGRQDAKSTYATRTPIQDTAPRARIDNVYEMAPMAANGTGWR